MAESKLAGPISWSTTTSWSKLAGPLQRVQCSACVQYAKPWPHSDIKSCCCQSTHDHVFTSSYDSTLLGRNFFYTEGVFA